LLVGVGLRLGRVEEVTEKYVGESLLDFLTILEFSKSIIQKPSWNDQSGNEVSYKI
tara:strand:- start:449 stop:616 length:168 start_codon:yes stop_codon:yes gene_type:complete